MTVSSGEISHQRNVIGVITARGGSKAVPGKNVAPLGNKPLIAWSIEAALQASTISRVIVSTDDEEIASVAKSFGAEIPFRRPAELALDNSSHEEVLTHAIQWLVEDEPNEIDYVMLLQPTSPFRLPLDIDLAVRVAEAKDADSVVSVFPSPLNPVLANRILEDGKLTWFAPPPEGYLSRHLLPEAYYRNGSIYLIRPDVFLQQQTLLPENSFAYVMPEERSMDIDTAWDLHVANLIVNDAADHNNLRLPFSSKSAA